MQATLKNIINRVLKEKLDLLDELNEELRATKSSWVDSGDVD